MKARWKICSLGGFGVAATFAGGPLLAEVETRDANEEPTPPPPVNRSTIAPADEQLVRKLLLDVGAENAPMKVVERSATRQAKVMYALAVEDLEKAQATYCDAGDAVLNRFNPHDTRDANVEAMKAELLRQLPRARELGCLNHIENTEVYTIDVHLTDVPAAKHEALAAAASEAVKTGKLDRFLQPPRHPGAFHFEFRRQPAQ
jgi:hypothetical protein